MNTSYHSPGVPFEPPRSTAPATSSKTVVQLKRRFYFAFLSVLAAASLGMWLYMAGPTISLAFIALPVVVAASLAGLLFLWLRPARVSVVERAIYWLAYPVLLGSLFLNLDAATTSAARQEALQSFSSWPKALAVWSFLAFGSKRGLLATLGFTVAVGAVIAVHLFGGARLESSGVLYLMQTLASGTVFLVMLFAFAHILELQILARSQAEAEAKFAMLDALTGLPNRRALEEHFERSRAHIHRSGESLVVCFIDVDDFKRINDTFGHDGGDSMLRQFAARLSTATREGDLVSRVGGDEFVVLATVADEAHARLLAGRLVAVFQAPFMLEGTEVSLYPSVGMSIYPQDGITLEAMLARADAAMYQAKADGKNAWVAASRHLASSSVAAPS